MNPAQIDLTLKSQNQKTVTILRNGLVRTADIGYTSSWAQYEVPHWIRVRGNVTSASSENEVVPRRFIRTERVIGFHDLSGS